MVMSLTIVIMPHAFAQEFTKSTFSENIVVVYDLSLFKDVGSFLMKKSAGDIEVVIGLQSTSNNDFKFSDELIKKIQSEDLIQSIVFTNMNDIDHKGDLVGCVPGVKGNEQCILVNLDFSEIKKFITDEDLEQADGRINRVQIETKKISDTLIEEINESLGTNAKFHSVFIQSQMTEYDVSDEGVVRTSAVNAGETNEKAPPTMARSSLVGIVFSIIITIFMAYKGIDYFTATKEIAGKTSIAVLNFDNIRKFKDYEWLGDEIAADLSYKLGGISSVRIIDRFQILNKLGEVDPEKASILDYKIEQIAKNIDVDHIIHGQFTIMERDSSIKIIAFIANTKTHDSKPLMKEKYPLANLSDIPTFINEKISSYVKTNFQMQVDTK